MNISRTQTDKLVVGTNDVSYSAPDISPSGSAILNGPVLIGKPSAAPGYEAVLNVASNGAPQNSLDTQPAYQSNLAASFPLLPQSTAPEKKASPSTNNLFVCPPLIFKAFGTLPSPTISILPSSLIPKEALNGG